MSIPVTVIVAAKNEERRLKSCLSALRDFDEIIVLDSCSKDRTKEIAAGLGARVENYQWDGRYPKKRQWALDNLALKNERVFFVDADEIVTPALVAEIAALDWKHQGYFVKGRYMFEGRLLRHGLCNNKLALFDRRFIHFPVVDDLGLPGMGEIEGHYQPVAKAPGISLGQIHAHLIHDAYDANWTLRHERYAAWEAGMNQRGAWPREGSKNRMILKVIFRHMPFRWLVAFLHSYVLKAGFMDGSRGFRFAQSRAAYYRMISRANRDLAANGGWSTAQPAPDK